MIKNFDTFEANLVMSTLSPEEESVLLQQQPADQSQRSVHLPNIDQSQSILANAELPSISTDTDANASVADISIQRKRNRIVSQETPVNAKDNEILQVANDNEDGCDILRKRRKTMERRDTENLPTSTTNRRTIENPPPPECDLLSENINVVFQDESHDTGLFSNDDDDVLLADIVNDILQRGRHDRPARRGRDHRPTVRHVFNRCFTGNSQQSENLGDVLVDCSDEEQNDK